MHLLYGGEKAHLVRDKYVHANKRLVQQRESEDLFLAASEIEKPPTVGDLDYIREKKKEKGISSPSKGESWHRGNITLKKRKGATTVGITKKGTA